MTTETKEDVTKTTEKEDITKKALQTTTELFGYDSKLSDLDIKKWGQAASADSIEKARKAFEDRKYKVDVAETGADALKILTSMDVKDASIYVAGSTTLSQIGFTHFLQENKNWAKRNIKGEYAAAMGTGDMSKAGKLMTEGQGADVFFSSCASVSETGEIHVVCASGSRSGGFIAAGRLVVVIGSQKIAKDHAQMIQRTREYALPLESARARIAFKSWGVTGSSINYETVLHSGNPFGAPRVHVIIIKEAIGF